MMLSPITLIYIATAASIFFTKSLNITVFCFAIPTYKYDVTSDPS